MFSFVAKSGRNEQEVPGVDLPGASLCCICRSFEYGKDAA
jgi:hypothetical protein